MLHEGLMACQSIEIHKQYKITFIVCSLKDLLLHIEAIYGESCDFCINFQHKSYKVNSSRFPKAKEYECDSVVMYI